MLKENERIDDLQLDNLRIIQNPEFFCFGTDAVLLSNFAQIKKNQVVVDLGTGTGIIPILLSYKSKASKIYGIEIQQNVFDMAKRSVILNQLEDKIEIINDDIKNIDKLFGKCSIDAIVTNPPYKNGGTGIVNSADTKAISRHEVLIKLEQIIEKSSIVLKPEGKIFMVHRPERMVDILVGFRKYNIEPKRIQFIHPKYNKAPNLVLIEGQKDGGQFLKVEDPIYVYDLEGKYSQSIKDIYGIDK